MNSELMLLLRPLGVVVGVPLVTVLLGRVVLGQARGLDRAERLACSWGLGFALLALGQFLAFVTRTNQTLVLVPIFLIRLASFVRQRGHSACSVHQEPEFPVGLFVLGQTHLVALQALLPIYIGGNWYFDWWMHYDEALIFLGLRPVDTRWAGVYTLASRTPLFNLTTASVMAVAGHDFWVFQLASTSANYAFVFAVFLVLRDLFGLRAARLGLILVPLNLWIMHNAWFTWSKMLTAYYIFISLHFYLRWVRLRTEGPGVARSMILYFWVASLLGFLTHQVALVYLVALLVHAVAVTVRDRRSAKIDWSMSPTLAGLALAFVGPWYVWLAVKFGLEGGFANTPAAVVGNEAAARTSARLVSFVYNLAASIVPDLRPRGLASWPPDVRTVYKRLTALYFCQVPGLLTFSLTLFIVMRSRRISRTPPGSPLRGSDMWSAVLVFAILGGLAAAALVPLKYRYGIAHAAFFPSALVLAIWAWGVLSRSSGRWTSWTCAGMAFEFLAMFWSHLFSIGRALPKNDNFILKQRNHLTFLADLLGPVRPLMIIACIAIQVGLCVLLVSRVRTDRRTNANSRG